MLNPFGFSLGGIPITLVTDEAPGKYEVPAAFLEFCDSSEADIALHIHSGNFPDLQDARLCFDTSISWQWLQLGAKRIIKAISAHQDPYLLGIFDPDFRSGDIYTQKSRLNPNQFVFPLAHPMGQLFMVNLLGTGLGMVFHAAGVIYKGEGYLFAGYGEAGKSTTAALWQSVPGALAVNDDKVIVRKTSTGYQLYGSPWPGMGGMALPDSAPLKKVFIIEHAASNQSKALTPVQAASELLVRAMLPLWDADKMVFTLDFLGQLTQDIPCQKLGFVPDKSVIDFVLSL